MAKKTSTTKNSKKTTVEQIEKSITQKDKIRFIVGIGLLFLSIFIIISLISYSTSWTKDQSHILSAQSAFSYLFYDDSPVMNWCGRLGATISHILIYQCIGLMAYVGAIWLGLVALNILYGKYSFPSRTWFRWLMFGILFVSPLLSLLFKNSSFVYGGMFGEFITNWTFGLAGTIGTWFVLLTIGFIFLILVFQWDIKPYITKLQTISFTKRSSEDFYSNDEKNTNSDSIRIVHKDEDDYLNDDINEYPSTLKMDEQYTVQNHYDDSNNWENEDDNDVLEQEEISNEELTLVEIDETEQETDPDVPVITSNEHIDVAGETLTTNKGGIVLEIPQIRESGIEDVQANKIDLEVTTSPEPSKNDVTNTNTIDGLEVIQSKEEDTVNIDGSKAIVDVRNLDDPYDPDLDLRDYKFPILDLLEEPQVEGIALDAEELAKNKEQIINTLRSFGIEIQRIQATVGPTVTLYEIVPQEGVRISKIRNLEDDIALNLAALGIRMIAPIPGKGTIGIEVPNAKKQVVAMRTLLSSEKFINNSMSLPIALGKKIDNENYIVDLATMPHLLMAGATGQGKSVGINAILVSLLYKKHPSQLKFVLVDPKKVELSIYKTIENHYLAKLPNEEEAIITDTKKVINTLSSLCIEMDNRYELLKDAGARNVKEYNAKFISRKLNPERGHKYLPFIVLVIDEFADLIMTAGKEVETPVARLAQLARAVGIHLIVATQRPSVNVITGIIKANFPARIAFRVTSKVDSRTILDTGGADQLVGRGDMLVAVGSDLLRVQCAFVDTPEVEKVVEYIGNQRGFPTPYELPEYEGAEDEEFEKKDVDLTKRDKLFEDCARLVVNSQSGSTSMLQRKFNLGFNRAGRIMDQLEAAGIVGAQSGSKPRDVLVTSESELEHILSML